MKRFLSTIIYIFHDVSRLACVTYMEISTVCWLVLAVQWLIGVPNATTFMGCIGRDEFGRILEKKVIEAGVNPRYKYHDTEPTGTCAVCLTGTNR